MMVLQNFFYDVLFADFSLYHSPRKLVWFEQLPLYTPFHEQWNFFLRQATSKEWKREERTCQIWTFEKFATWNLVRVTFWVCWYLISVDISINIENNSFWKPEDLKLITDLSQQAFFVKILTTFYCWDPGILKRTHKNHENSPKIPFTW